jgi:RNA polymerase sigma factor (sigma-70 family)
MNEPLPKRAWALAVHYRWELHRYLLRRMGRAQEVEDLEQEIYLRLLRMDQMECVREPLAYLYTVASNVVADYTIAQRQKGHVTVDSDAVENWANDPEKALPDNLADRMNLERRLEQALKELPALQAKALVLHYQEGMYCEEIAAKLGLSPKSVDKYLARGKARMRQLLWDL